MEIKKIIKESFSVIGKLGSTKDGEHFIKELWENANINFNEISCLAKKDTNNNIVGIWGLMSDFSQSLNPWEDNFTKGLYLAGVEVDNEIKEIEGWVKWTVPSFEYLVVKSSTDSVFSDTIKYIKLNNMNLVAAVFDFTDPILNENYMYFPIRKID